MTVKRKRLISAILTFVMVLSLTNVFPAGKSAYAAEQSNDTNQGNSYHYDQLTELGKKVYDGMVAMSKKDGFKAGTASYDLVTEGGLTANDVSSNTELNKAMYAARYAFYADHPEIFYVDFSKLALRTTQGNDGRKHVTIGSGRNANYLNEGLKNQEAVEYAITEFNTRVNEIVKGANAVTEPLNGSLQAARIKYVHKEINENVAYRMEDSAYPGDITDGAKLVDQNGDVFKNAPLLGTPYGVLVRKQGVCEGYARAFKAVMDKLGINCIQVQGAHQYSGEVAVGHMWNYVEITDSNTATSGAAKMRAARTIGGKWYAVDATLDDPEFPVDTAAEIDAECKTYENTFDPTKLPPETTKYGTSGFEFEKYLLAGQLTMNQEHFAAEEVVAAGDYHFDYPVLEDNDFTITNVTNDLDGFIVKTKDVTDKESGQLATEYQFSYRGMTVSEARQKGIYLVWRYYNLNDKGEIVPIHSTVKNPDLTDYSWMYLNPAYMLAEEDGFTSVREYQNPYVEIAATTVPPEFENKENPTLAEIAKNGVYQGDDAGLIARTGKIANPNQHKYHAPPYIKRQTPTATSCISVSNRYFHITVEYDETLKKAEGKNGNETKITCHDNIGSDVTGAEYSDIKNFRWDGDKTVEFDMKFSAMFADDNVIYRIYLEGLVGKESNKTPNPVVYAAAQRTTCPSIMQRDGNWDIFGKPTLLASDDLSTKDWKLSNGQNVSERLADRLTLVTTKTTEKQEEQMDQALKNNAEIDENKIISSATYNITLSVCKAVVVHTGDKVKVRLGFPDGYGPDDEGVTFKAYHFKRDNQGNVTGVEEIPCVITQYGLIITCDAFSPFTIAAVEADPNEPASTSKTLVVTTSDGGAATSDNWDNNTPGMVTLNENDSKTLKFTPNEGYQIESITVCGVTKEVTAGEDGSATVTVNYNDVKDAANNIVNANFVAKTVAQAEEEAGQTVVEPTVPEVTVTIPATKSCGANGTLSIVPESIAEVTDGVQTYQWYKVAEDDTETLLEGKVNRILEIPNVQNDAAGNYKLKVTTTVGTVSRVDTSNACAVTITACEHNNKTTHEAVAPTCKTEGNAEYVTCNDCGALVSGSQKPLKTVAHNYVQDATEGHLKEAATCSKSAVYYESCTMCHENGTATFAAGELAEHSYVENTAANHLKSAATCISPAVYYKSCSMCGQDRMTETFTSGEVDPDNHGETEIRNAKEATETEAGYTGDTYCKACDQKIADGKTISKPTVTIPESESVVAGETLAIEPEVSAVDTDGTQTYQWYKNDAELDGQTSKTLTIESVTTNDAGTYTLKVTNTVDDTNAETMSTGCEVTVMAQPTGAAIVMPESQSVAVGEQLTITPTVSEQSGYTQTYQWFKDNEELSGKTEKILTIDKAALTDAGTYTLKVTTKIGNASAVATSSGCVVTVTEPEDPEKPVDPNNLTVSITGGKIIKINGIPVPEDEGTITSGSYPFNTVLTVEPENAGAFTGWKMGDTYISYSQTYQFYVKTSMDITADSTVVEKKEPLVTFMQKTRDADDAGKQTVKLGISVDVPEGFEVVSEGIIRSYRKPDIEADDQNKTGLEIGKTGVTNQVSKKVFSQGSYTYSFTIAKNSANKTKPVYARGYVRYKASDSDEIQTVYTGIETLEPETAG